jgi:hypothetical protein
MELVASTSVSDLVANVQSSTTTGVTSVLVIAALAVSIPLAFYVIHQVIALFPKTRSRRY